MRKETQDKLNSPQAGNDENEVYQELRPLLFSLAYRMLGSVSEAEDIVQEAALRFHRTLAQGTAIDSPKAFLTTVTTHLAIDAWRAGRTKRETYIGVWLPEPLLTATEPDPADRVEARESLSLAFLILLQTLSPIERAVFLLREVFDYDYEQIAEIIHKREENCRQIFVRARKRIEERKPRFQAQDQAQQELARRFFAAAGQGDLSSLVTFLAADVALYGDGG